MAAKNTFFSTNTTLNCRGQLVDLSLPKVMGILNVSPDSFFDGGRFSSKAAIVEQVKKMLEEGATFIDVGAVSSRPGADFVSAKDEVTRLLPVVEMLVERFPNILLSVDTWRAEVAQKSLEKGACMINDISGGQWDEDLFDVVNEFQVPYILMHSKGTPENMQKNPQYENVVEEIIEFFDRQLSKLRLNDVILDPGFGFGKSVEHNFEILKRLNEFRLFGRPVLAGISRKSMICKTLQVNPENALNGTTALDVLAVQSGAQILRVHDVKEAVEVVRLVGGL